jgi:glucokinase
MTCLIADLGATNARFAVADGKHMNHLEVYQSSNHSTILEAVQTYLEEVASRGLPRPTKAALAVAAPISADQDQVTYPNKLWSFSKRELQKQLEIEIDFYNDFSAVALAVPHLPDGQKLELRGTVSRVHRAPVGPIAVIGPGTGLGVASVIRVADRWIDLSGEGGHATMAPATREESEILNILRIRWGHVSAERVLSGPGLANIYSALCTIHSVESRELKPEEITAAALANSQNSNEHTNVLSARAFNIFCGMLGTVAGNLALTLGATGGVYIAGGILPRFKQLFADSIFRARFEQKGRLTWFMEHIPTFLVLQPAAALSGLLHDQMARSKRSG